MRSLINKTTFILFISGVLIGRYVITPKPKVITKEVVKIVEVEKKQTKKKKVTTEIVNPDGSSSTQTTEVEDTITETVTDTINTKDTKPKLGITLGMLAIKDISKFSSPINYGATVGVPLMGSISVVGLATTSRQIGVGLSIEF